MTTVRSRQRPPSFKVRRSSVHGRGAFALRRIRKGTRIVEYLGERVSHTDADRRYEGRDEDDSHTFLFVVDSKTVIDGGTEGNDARFINHSCNPNCESMIEGKRVFIKALRTIQPGEELSYDYQLGRDEDDPPNVDEIYACRCGHANCRGSMLWPPRRAARKSASARARRSRSATTAPAKTARPKRKAAVKRSTPRTPAKAPRR